MMREIAAEFLDQVTRWGTVDDGISAILLIGSYAGGDPAPDSDVDLVILADNPARFLAVRYWLNEFGPQSDFKLENWGRVQSLRARFRNGLEVEFGFTDRGWLALPLDAGTSQALEGGFRFLVDKQQFALKLGS